MPTPKVVDLLGMARSGACNSEPGVYRQELMDGPHFQSWLHVYIEPGNKDELHCHNADETFYCIDGECTVRFPEGPPSVMEPGMVALIPGGQFYQLENTGSGRMIMMGTRAISGAAALTIDYQTRERVTYPGQKERKVPQSTSILV